MEAETLLALGDALTTQGLQDEARDSWQQAHQIFSAFLLPESGNAQSRLLMHKQPLPAPDVSAVLGRRGHL
jgi:hypothetical protein